LRARPSSSAQAPERDECGVFEASPVSCGLKLERHQEAARRVFEMRLGCIALREESEMPAGAVDMKAWR
jgi:hypothetical protein